MIAAGIHWVMCPPSEKVNTIRMATAPNTLARAIFHISWKLAKRHMSLDQDVEQTSAEEPPGDIRKMMEALPAGQQEVVWLRFVDGLDLREIAEAMEVPIGTVKSRLHAAIQTLKRRTR